MFHTLVVIGPQALEIQANNRFPQAGVLTITGNTWRYAGSSVSGGKQHQYKGTFVFASDLASGTFKDEISLDGKTWTTCEESKYTKVKPAAKK